MSNRLSMTESWEQQAVDEIIEKEEMIKTCKKHRDWLEEVVVPQYLNTVEEHYWQSRLEYWQEKIEEMENALATL